MNNAILRKWASILIGSAVVLTLPVSVLARDPGVNQRGAAGNKGAAPGKDPGINQPGAAGNARGAAAKKDPGVNQPGATGNRRGAGRR